jgi:hypothetical protein
MAVGVDADRRLWRAVTSAANDWGGLLALVYPFFTKETKPEKKSGPVCRWAALRPFEE